MRLSLGTAALAATFIAASPAFAQTSSQATATASGTILETNSLTKITDLDFGTIAADDTVAGTVTVDADSGARSGTDVSLLPGTYQRAEFVARGVADQVVDFVLTQPAGNALANAGGDTIGATLSLDSGGVSRTVPASGNITLYVGGVFDIAAQQPNGVYTGDFDLTANFP